MVSGHLGLGLAGQQVPGFWRDVLFTVRALRKDVGCSKGGSVAECGCVRDMWQISRGFSLLMGILWPSVPAALSPSSPGEGEKLEHGWQKRLGAPAVSCTPLPITPRAKRAKLRDVNDFPGGIELFFRLQSLQISYFQCEVDQLYRRNLLSHIHEHVHTRAGTCRLSGKLSWG